MFYTKCANYQKRSNATFLFLLSICQLSREKNDANRILSLIWIRWEENVQGEEWVINNIDHLAIVNKNMKYEGQDKQKWAFDQILHKQKRNTFSRS